MAFVNKTITIFECRLDFQTFKFLLINEILCYRLRKKYK